MTHDTHRTSGNYGFPWRVSEGLVEDLGVWIVTDRYGALVLRTKAKGIADLVVEMGNSRVGQTRIQAAERAVIEAALGLFVNVNETTIGLTGADGLLERRDRLRDLREQARAEECGRLIERWISRAEIEKRDTDEGVIRMRCHLPRGHEGKHAGSLGDWSWE